jgi:hypothetical protein
MHPALTSSAKGEMLSISPFAEMIRGDRLTINISPLCGDDLVHSLQRTNRRTLAAKPKPVDTDLPLYTSLPPRSDLGDLPETPMK